MAFRTWINEVGLIDLGHCGPAYTWNNHQPGTANVAQRLDRALASLSWAMKFPATSVYPLPKFKSDHSPILVKLNPQLSKERRKFQTENWWMIKPGFEQVCQRVAQEGSCNWEKTRKAFKTEVRKWVKVQVTPDGMLKDVESRMASLNALQPDLVDRQEESNLQAEHDRILLMRESCWYQWARVNRALFGDSNSKFFHATATTRRRRNLIKAIQIRDGEWETSEKGIKNAFLSHFRGIYTAGPTQPVLEEIGPETLRLFPQVPTHAKLPLTAQPTVHEIHSAVMALGPDKAPGPDGINARLIQANWEHFGPSILTEVQSFFLTGTMAAGVARSNIVLVPKS